MAGTELEPTEDPGTAWYPGRTVAVVQDPDWTRASVPANPDRIWEVRYAQIIYAPRQFFRFCLWATESIYKLALLIGTIIMIILMIHS